MIIKLHEWIKNRKKTDSNENDLTDSNPDRCDKIIIQSLLNHLKEMNQQIESHLNEKSSGDKREEEI
jgi:hypothetical protein